MYINNSPKQTNNFSFRNFVNCQGKQKERKCLEYFLFINNCDMADVLVRYLIKHTYMKWFQQRARWFQGVVE